MSPLIHALAYPVLNSLSVLVAGESGGGKRGADGRGDKLGPK